MVDEVFLRQLLQEYYPELDDLALARLTKGAECEMILALSNFIKKMKNPKI